MEQLNENAAKDTLLAGLNYLRQKDYSAAFQCFRETAEQGNLPAMNNLAMCYSKGVGTAVSQKDAFAWMKKAAEGGYAGVYYNLALAYRDGTGTDRNPAEALRWARLAVREDAKHSDAAAELAATLETVAKPDDGTEELTRGNELTDAGDEAGAIPFYLAAAEKNNMEAIYRLISAYQEGIGVERNEMIALKWAQKAIALGDGMACVAAATLYYNGDGVECDLDQAEYWAREALNRGVDDPYVQELLEDIVKYRQRNANPDIVEAGCKCLEEGKDEEAVRYFQEASDLGNAYGMFKLAQCLSEGRGIARNCEAAFSLMQKAADLGLRNAYTVLSEWFLNGNGTEVNLDQAEYWANCALEAGDEAEIAQQLLAAIEQARNPQLDDGTYDNDRGYNYIEQNDFENAFQCFQIAALKGNVVAMNNLSVCYARGNGIPKNPEQAFLWMKMAAENGASCAYFPLACKYYDGEGTQINLEQAEFWAMKVTQENDSWQSTQDLLKEIHKRKKAEEDGGADVDRGIEFVQQKDNDNAFRCFLTAAHKGNRIGMSNLAVFYENGLGTPKNISEAFRWMKQSAEAGHEDAKYFLARYYKNGLGTVQDLTQAEFWASRVSQNSSQWQNAQNLLEEIRRQKAEAASDDGGADVDRGVAYFQQKDNDNAFRYFLTAAQKGNRIGMSNLAVFYENGFGTPKNISEAFRWMKRSAEAGHEDAKYFLALYYKNGLGTVQDLTQAEFWASRVSQNTNQWQNAQNLLVEIRRQKADAVADDGRKEDDQGIAYVQQGDFINAFRCFQIAAQKGCASAMNNLSVCYANGNGVKANPVEAFQWMKKAAEAGSNAAKYTLAVKYMKGTGTQVDYEQAEYWIKQVLDDPQNGKEAKTLLEEIRMYKNTCGDGRAEVDEGVNCLNRQDHANAVRLFNIAVSKGNTLAMHNLSVCYANGYGVPMDKQQAFYWMKQAAEKGALCSYFVLASKYYDGSGTPKDLDQAAYWAAKIPEGYGTWKQAQTLLAAIRQQKTAASAPAAPAAPKSAYERNYPPRVREQLEEGKRLYGQGEFLNALRYLVPAGKAGHPEALHLIGVMYYDGRAVKQDYDKAVKFFEAAAIRGNREAVRYLATRITPSADTSPWELYAQDHHFRDCANAFDASIPKVRQKEWIIKCWDAADAMKQAVELLTSFKRGNGKVMLRDPYGGFPMTDQRLIKAATAFDRAVEYGDLDGLPGSVLISSITGNSGDASAFRSNSVGAYMGHSYCMFRVAQYYEGVNNRVANECYKLAAQWGYRPAAEICARKGIR